MQPERLLGKVYSVQSDIWSLGLSLVEMALGMYPIPKPDEETLAAIFETPISNSEESMDLDINLTPKFPEDSTLKLTLTYGSSSTEQMPFQMSNEVPSQKADILPISNERRPMSIFELLDYIVNEPPPQLPHKYFSGDFVQFVECCLQKNPDDRPKLRKLMVRFYTEGQIG